MRIGSNEDLGCGLWDEGYTLRVVTHNMKLATRNMILETRNTKKLK